MRTVQIFTANPRGFAGAAGPVNPAQAAAARAWRARCRAMGLARTAAHAGYLINLASPAAPLWRASVELLVAEIRRCDLLRIPYVVVHPGAHLGAGEEAGLANIGRALDEILERTRGARPMICLEGTSGQGSSLGHRLEHLALLRQRASNPRRIGFCLDTAHLFAAGYDFVGRKYPRFLRELDRTLGISRVKVWHLNDSKRELGSRVDRHEHIGRGKIGLEGFRPIVRDRSFVNVPKILETPKGRDSRGRSWDAVNLEILRSLM